MKGDQPQVGVFAGVDMGKERHWVQAITADGETLFEGSVGNDPAAAKQLLDQATATAGRNVGRRRPPPQHTSTSPSPKPKPPTTPNTNTT